MKKLVQMKAFFAGCIAAISPLLVYTACDSDGNSYSGSGTLQLAVGDMDSTTVYANVDATKESLGTYSNPIYMGSLNYPEFELSHYVRQGSFVGGITVTNQTDSLHATADNYASITGSGAGSHKSYLVADLSKTASVTFRTTTYYNVPLTPQFIYVTNATYTYMTMKEGSAQYPAFTTSDYLKLRITALNKNGGALTDKSVEVYLAANGTPLKKWQRVDLTDLGECYGLYFTLESTDGSTDVSIPLPPRFCFDLLTATYNYSIQY
jgi:hypothetical protein